MSQPFINGKLTFARYPPCPFKISMTSSNPLPASFFVSSRLCFMVFIIIEHRNYYFCARGIYQPLLNIPAAVGLLLEICGKENSNVNYLVPRQTEIHAFEQSLTLFLSVIHRGCSSEFFLPRPGLPESGCVQDPLENWWCFCMGDKCNTDDMSGYV